MNALIISASPHKENSKTFQLASQVASGLIESGAKVESLHLCDCRIEFCRQCEECHRKILACPIKDSVPGILGKMLEADAIIFASPNYLNQVTASMKALFDRSSHFFHCKRLLGKYAAGVVTSGSGRDTEVLNYIRYFCLACGAQYSGGVSCARFLLKDKMEEARQLGRQLYLDFSEKNTYPEQGKMVEAGRAYFKRVMMQRREDWKGEYEYWQKMGWI